MSHPAAPYAAAGQQAAARAPYQLPHPDEQARWSEDRLQQECLLWLQSFHPTAARLIYHVPNGGQRTARQAAAFQQMGVKAGVPDLCLPMAGNHHASGYFRANALYIELKRGTAGTVRPAQRAYHELLAAARNRVAVVRSLPEFVALLTEYLA